MLSTLHTNSAAATMPRLLDMDIEPFLIVSTVNVIIGQRLVRRLCSVKEKYFLDAAGIEALKKSVDLDRVMKVLKEENIVAPDATWSEVPFYRPQKSDECEDGYKGRVGIHEILKMSPAIRDMIIKGSTPVEIEAQAKKEGMTTMLEDGIMKATQGITTIEDVLRVVSE